MKSNKEANNHHPIIRQHLTIGQRAADRLTYFCGSWRFIFAVLGLIALWITMNTYMIVYRWDPRPFIMLNLLLSCFAALQAPVILMSQKRQAERDRLTLNYDYSVNKKAEREIEDVQKDLHEIKRLLSRRGIRKSQESSAHHTLKRVV